MMITLLGPKTGRKN